MKRYVIIAIALTGLIFTAPFAQGSSLSALTKEAEKRLKKEDVIGAAKALRQAMVALYNQASLKVNKATLISAKPRAFGMFQPKGTNQYRPGETIIIYVEPVGYHFAKKGNSYNFGIIADFSVTDLDGNILGGKKGFGKWEITTKDRPLFDFYITLTYNFTGIKPGKYFILTTLTDKNGGGSLTIKTPIEIVP